MGDINLIEILIYIINFLVTFLLLYILLYKPVSRFLSERRERTAATLKEAEETRKQAELILVEAEAELASTGEKARLLSHETIENAALAAEKIIDNAQEEASVLLLRAREQVETERQVSLEHAYTDLVSFASGLASRVLAREVSIDDNRSIIDHFFKENNMEIKYDDGLRIENSPAGKSPEQKEILS